MSAAKKAIKNKKKDTKRTREPKRIRTEMVVTDADWKKIMRIGWRERDKALLEMLKSTSNRGVTLREVMDRTGLGQSAAVKIESMNVRLKQANYPNMQLKSCGQNGTQTLYRFFLMRHVRA